MDRHRALGFTTLITLLMAAFILTSRLTIAQKQSDSSLASVIERGLLGYFICSNIENQYEFVLKEWAEKNSPSTRQAEEIVHCQISFQVGRPRGEGKGTLK
jgi:hypothetical protein